MWDGFYVPGFLRRVGCDGERARDRGSDMKLRAGKRKWSDSMIGRKRDDSLSGYLMGPELAEGARSASELPEGTLVIGWVLGETWKLGCQGSIDSRNTLAGFKSKMFYSLAVILAKMGIIVSAS